jgi:hypothetical protein
MSRPVTRRPALPAIAAAVAASLALGAREAPAQTAPVPAAKGVLRVGMRITAPPQPKPAQASPQASATAQAPSRSR